MQIKKKSYWLDDRRIEVRFPPGVRAFTLLHSIRTVSGAHPAAYTLGTGALSRSVNRPGREANNSPPSAEVKNNEAILPFVRTCLWRGV
jgi:hypothetical protein